MSNGRRWTPEDDARLREMSAAKQSVQAIAIDLGRSEPAVRARLPKLNLGLPQPIPAATNSSLENLISNYWQFAITIILGAAALSGKFSVIATQILFALAWAVILLGELRRSWLRRVGVALSTGAALILLALFFRPDAVPKFSGILTPKGQTIFDEKTPHPRIEIGDSGAFADQIKNGDLLLPFLKRDQLRVELIKGSYKFSARITDKNGDLIAEIVDNEWSVAPPRSYDRNYDDNALEVRDNSGDVVLQVQALPDRIQVQGVWWSDSSPWGPHVRLAFYTLGTLTPSFQHETYWSDEPIIGPVKDSSSRGVVAIRPLFKYPSDRHLGERIPLTSTFPKHPATSMHMLVK